MSYEKKTYTIKDNVISLLIGGVLGLYFGCCHYQSVMSYQNQQTPDINVTIVEECYVIPEFQEHGDDILDDQITVEEIVQKSESMWTEEELHDIFLLEQLVQAEAGNQDLMGKQLVVDVVLNRVADPRFPDTIEEVIFQTDPVQFSVTIDGAWERAADNIIDSDVEAVMLEYGNKRVNDGILYFSLTPCNGTNHFKHGDHWFGY